MNDKVEPINLEPLLRALDDTCRTDLSNYGLACEARGWNNALERIRRVLPQLTPDTQASFDAWLAHPYTRIVLECIKKDFVPRANYQQAAEAAKEITIDHLLELARTAELVGKHASVTLREKLDKYARLIMNDPLIREVFIRTNPLVFPIPKEPDMSNIAAIMKNIQEMLGQMHGALKPDAPMEFIEPSFKNVPSVPGVPVEPEVPPAGPQTVVATLPRELPKLDGATWDVDPNNQGEVVAEKKELTTEEVVEVCAQAAYNEARKYSSISIEDADRITAAVRATLHTIQMKEEGEENE